MPGEELYLPIYNSIKKYRDKGLLPFHMPGHKLGKGLPQQLGQNLAELDITELAGTDDLHHPTGAIKEAQELAAKVFKADKTYFLVNGSTCGVHAMIKTICKPGDSLVIARDCHKSVINGLYLAGAEPIYIEPQYNSKLGFGTPVPAEDIGLILDKHPEAVGVLITRPTYYGVCSDIKAIAEHVHKRGKILAVDEAHGPHLCFCSSLPLSAMEAGADMCVQSAHKTLPALTQGAYLHIKGKSIDLARLEYILSAIQTSSPSYIIMATLDAARALMEYQGSELLGDLLENCREIRRMLTESGGLYSPSSNDIINGEMDETRLVVNVNEAGISGYKAEAILRENFSIQPEMSDLLNVVFIAGVSDRGWEFNRLGEALSSLCRHKESPIFCREIIPEPPELPEQRISLCEALDGKQAQIPLKEARGGISTRTITPYPPGIPLINPGEIISDNMIVYIEEIIKAGGNVSGMADNGYVYVLVG